MNFVVVKPVITSTRGISKNNTFPYISETVHIPVAKFSNRMMTSGLDNERSKTGVINRSTSLNAVKSIYYPSTQSCQFQACHANPST